MKPDIHSLREPDYWQQVWEETRKSSSYITKRIRDEKEAIEIWNKFASTYGKHSSCGEQERLEKVIGLLEQKKILTPETEILDVGCGPGTYALPFAGRVKSVTALDGASEMCRVLEHKAKETELHNITVLHRMWEDVDLSKEGLFQSFDLVFASLTPAVCNYETIVKLNQASKKYCCLISWAGGTFSQARQDLWKLLFKEEEDVNRGFDIIFPFNLIYSMGYYPTMHYIDTGWVLEGPVEQAIESLSRSFWLYTEITPEINNTITRYVLEWAVNGIFCQKSKSRLGIITWRVN